MRKSLKMFGSMDVPQQLLRILGSWHEGPGLQIQVQLHFGGLLGV